MLFEGNSVMNYNELILKIDSLTVFSALKSDPVLSGLRKFLQTFSVADYSNMVAALYPATDSLSEYIRRITLNDDNFYVKEVAAGREMSAEIETAVRMELDVLEEIASVSSAEIQAEMRKHHREFYLPVWKTTELNLKEDFAEKLANITKTGYGIFAMFSFFRIVDGNVVPVAHPDFQPLDTLFRYERERQLIIRNTEALLAGEGAGNVLLYGDMGTGKSSTIKAVAAAYAHQGLRIIEIKKEQLFMLPDIMDILADNPLKFILFIDDLSFAGNDDNFSALKAVLEGSISGITGNTVIYATSNRRHLVRESARDRQGGIGLDDDLHLNDTLQETMSLAARFGLTITFQKPNKDDYLQIVRSLADEYGIVNITEENLFKRAEAFAIRKNGRSPRTARQFIELLKIGI
jgi:predicted AAA+ superfamily ATPase